MPVKAWPVWRGADGCRSRGSKVAAGRSFDVRQQLRVSHESIRMRSLVTSSRRTHHVLDCMLSEASLGAGGEGAALNQIAA